MVLGGPEPQEAAIVEAMAAMAEALQGYADTCAAVAQEFNDRAASCNGSGADMERSVKDLKTAVGDLMSHLVATSRFIDEINTATPYPRFIDKLPEDVIQLIFQMADVKEEEAHGSQEAYDSTPSKLEPDFPQIAAAVSSYWRAMVLERPVLWRRIRVDPWHAVSWTALHLKRSRDLELHVDWNYQAEGHSLYDGHIHALALHSPRIAELSLRTQSNFPPHFTTQILRPFRTLDSVRSLTVHGSFPDDPLPSNTHPEFSLPNLEVLRVSGGYCLEGSRLQGLRVLEVVAYNEGSRPTWPQLCTVLSASPDMEELSLTWDTKHSLTILWREEDTAGPLPLPKLRSLRLWRVPGPTCKELFSAIEAPGLISISLCIRADHLIGVPLVDFVLNTLSSLETLTIRSSQLFQHELTAIMNAFPPRLRRLALEIVNPNYNEVVAPDAFLLTGLAKCPKLSHLGLIGVRWYPPALLGMVKARSRGEDGCCPLQAMDFDVKIPDIPGCVREALEEMNVQVGFK